MAKYIFLKNNSLNSVILRDFFLILKLNDQYLIVKNQNNN